MKIFRDTKNREWKLELNCDTIQAAKEALGINVLDIEDPESGLLAELIAFPPMCCKIIQALIVDQLTAAKVEEKDFRQSMDGDALGNAMEALRAEIVNFFPKSRRPLLAEVRAKQRAVEVKGVEVALAKINDPKLMEAVERDLVKRMDAEIARILGPQVLEPESSKTAGKPLESSESIPVA